MRFETMNVTSRRSSFPHPMAVTRDTAMLTMSPPLLGFLAAPLTACPHDLAYTLYLGFLPLTTWYKAPLIEKHFSTIFFSQPCSPPPSGSRCCPSCISAVKWRWTVFFPGAFQCPWRWAEKSWCVWDLKWLWGAGCIISFSPDGLCLCWGKDSSLRQKGDRLGVPSQTSLWEPLELVS